MKKKSDKNQKQSVRVGIQPIVGATRYTIKEGNKSKILDVFKKKTATNRN